MKFDKLLTLSLAELRERFLVQGRPIPNGLLEALETDSRRGARVLAEQLAERRRENRAEGQRLRHLLDHERALWSEGYLHVGGVDEAGMAPLAGPVVAGAVILPRTFRPRGIDDSKKLDARAREALAEQIRAEAICWGIGIAEVHEIDTLNIYQAGLLALRRAVEALSPLPDFLLVDARTVPGLAMRQRGLVRGDALSLTIAAASILAKTTRDRMLTELAERYPGYGFERHKGYPTAEHFAALRRLGACEIHRRSFAPVREALGLTPRQAELPLEPGPTPPTQGMLRRAE